MMTYEEWKERRREGIGGSDWKHVLNIPPFGCALRCWNEKVGTEADFPEEENAFMTRGKRLEAIFAEEFETITGRRVQRKTTFRKQDGLPVWWVGNIDRMIQREEGDPSPGVLEIKTAGEYAYRKVMREGPPEDHTLQNQHYLGLTGWDWGIYFVGNADSWSFREEHFRRDEGLLKSMVEAGDAFWQMVVAGTPPPHPKKRLRACGDCPFRLKCWAGFDAKDGEDVETEHLVDEVPTLAAAVRAEREAKALKDDADAIYEDAVAALKKGIEAHGVEAFRAAGFRVYYKEQKGRVTLDSKGLKAKYPELYEQFSKTGAPFRALRVYEEESHGQG